MTNNQSPTSRFNSTSLMSCESPFERLSAFVTTLRAACEQLETHLHGSELEARLKVSSDGYASEHSPSEVLISDSEQTVA